MGTYKAILYHQVTGCTSISQCGNVAGQRSLDGEIFESKGAFLTESFEVCLKEAQGQQKRDRMGCEFIIRVYRGEAGSPVLSYFINKKIMLFTPSRFGELTEDEQALYNQYAENTEEQ